jgi:hypothetical protein
LYKYRTCVDQKIGFQVEQLTDSVYRNVKLICSNIAKCRKTTLYAFIDVANSAPGPKRASCDTTVFLSRYYLQMFDSVIGGWRRLSGIRPLPHTTVLLIRVTIRSVLLHSLPLLSWVKHQRIPQLSTIRAASFNKFTSTTVRCRIVRPDFLTRFFRGASRGEKCGLDHQKRLVKSSRMSLTSILAQCPKMWANHGRFWDSYWT